MFTVRFFFILDRKSFIKIKHNIFLPIFIYGIQYSQRWAALVIKVAPQVHAQRRKRFRNPQKIIAPQAQPQV